MGGVGIVLSASRDSHYSEVKGRQQDTKSESGNYIRIDPDACLYFFLKLKIYNG
jgi:hypothetical protein